MREGEGRGWGAARWQAGGRALPMREGAARAAGLKKFFSYRCVDDDCASKGRAARQGPQARPRRVLQRPGATPVRGARAARAPRVPNDCVREQGGSRVTYRRAGSGPRRMIAAPQDPERADRSIRAARAGRDSGQARFQPPTPPQGHPPPQASPSAGQPPSGQRARLARTRARRAAALEFAAPIRQHCGCASVWRSRRRPAPWGG
jgi:hypothetical protein